MTAFVTAYLMVWLAVASYMAWLQVQQRRLARSIESLRVQLEDSEATERPVSKAA